MKKATKIWLITAAVLVVAGIIIFGGAMTMIKWDFLRLSTVKYETNSYDISEAFEDISIKGDVADITFLPSEDGKTSVECIEREKVKHSVSVKDGVLVIESVDERKWYEHIEIISADMSITLRIPQGEYGRLSIDSSTGDITVPKEHSFKSMDISQSTGDITSHASVSESLSIKVTTGDIRIENISAGSLELSVSTGEITASGVDCDGDVKLSTTTGKNCLTDVRCKSLTSDGDTGDLIMKNVVVSEKISVKRSTGDVTLDSSDAAELYIRTTTGDVKGTLLTEKIFIADTDTGRKDVPNTLSGGKCDVTTDTGDIKFSIKNK